MRISLEQALAGIPAEGEPFYQVLKEPHMRAVIYTPRQVDTQEPHLEDEVYLVVQGRAVLEVGSATYPCRPGDLLYVEARTEHHFRDFSDDFTVWAVFGPKLSPGKVSVEESDLAQIAELEAAIPEFDHPYALEALQERIAGRPYLALVARVQGQAVGYKLGYAHRPQRFYSWLGGVLPTHRRQGVARALLRHQENWCAERYKAIEVRSQNRYRGMLMLLLSEGYEVQGLSAGGMITFRKGL